MSSLRTAATALAGLVLGNGVALLASAGDVDVAAACDFDLMPIFPGFFWDETCAEGDLGCNADGKNVACRYCGGGNYSDIDCPPSSCQFPNEPFVSYYWDNDCKLGMLGCWADGIHEQCRFCGDAPFTQVMCPEVVGGRGHGDASCFFDNQPWVPTYWDDNCTNGMLGCLADGVHEKCRFCAIRPFQDIPCPEGVAVPQLECVWPENSEPLIPFYWDEECEMGKLGCWADGIHAECRFCGHSTFAGIPCPTEDSDVAEENETDTLETAAQAAQAIRSESTGVSRAADEPAENAEADEELQVSASHSLQTLGLADLLLLGVTGAIITRL